MIYIYTVDRYIYIHIRYTRIDRDIDIIDIRYTCIYRNIDMDGNGKCIIWYLYHSWVSTYNKLIVRWHQKNHLKFSKFGVLREEIR